MSVTNRAGHPARTDRNDSHAQNSSGTTCDGCQERDAEGIDADGRSLCRPCARRTETLVADGGLVIAGLSDAADTARETIQAFEGVDAKHYSVRTSSACVYIETERKYTLDEPLVDAIEREASVKFCGALPRTDGKCGLLGRFRLADDSDEIETLDQLASEFQNRREQASIVADDYAEMGQETLAEQYTGRAIGFADARAAIRHQREGGRDE